MTSPNFNDRMVLGKSKPLEFESKRYAPLVYGSGLLETKHKESCPYYDGYIRGLERERLVGQTHTVRGICTCMDPFTIDKAFVMELQGRELGFAAYEAAKTMMHTYGKETVLSHTDLNNVICLAVYAQHVYDAIQACTNDGKLQSTVLFSCREVERRFEADMSMSEEDGGSKRNMVKRYSGYDIVKRRLQVRKRSGDTTSTMMGVPAVVSETPWVPVVDDAACRVWFKAIPGTPIISFRLDGTIDASLLDFLAIASEVDMTSKWIPYFKFPMKLGLQSAKCIARYGRFDKISQYKVDLPWPLKSRDCVVHGWLTDDLEKNNKLLLALRSFDADETSDVVPEVDPGYVRVTMDGGCVIEALGPERIVLSTVWVVNPKEKVPAKLVKFVAGVFIKSAFEKFARFCKSVQEDPDFALARQTDQWLYGYVEQRIGDLKRNGVDVMRARD
ncbi:MAG: hypothetical protein KVP17_002074 [Porospora cf. gigantea B]|uniref:uncharacterized protein n=1 Tax=Porospora cf. gigantea B TaxID=2853592 RepID=UPI0035719939|nr:MAG: hypothetical protein KVP17_002074 [Porospora cf. gigantea B]